MIVSKILFFSNLQSYTGCTPLENAGRQQSKTKEGKLQFSLHFPKFKQGGHVVRKVQVPQTFGKSPIEP